LMVGERNELNTVMKVRLVPIILFLALALAGPLPQAQGYYQKYAYPDYSSGFQQNYPQYQNLDSYSDPTYGDINYKNYDYNTNTNNKLDAQQQLRAGLMAGIQQQKLQEKIDEEMRQLFSAEGSNIDTTIPRQDQGKVPSLAELSGMPWTPEGQVGRQPEHHPAGEAGLQVEKKHDVPEPKHVAPKSSPFPRLTLRQKQFALNPGVPEFYQEDPNFFNFRLEELDEELRRGGKTGDAQPADGSGDSEDPQQILLGAKRARIGTASHLRWEDFAMDNKDTDFFFTIAIAVSTAFAVMGVVGAGYCYHRRIRVWKDSEEVEYPSYGVTGPAKDVSPGSDRKLAQSAQIYHYQHQKNQMLGNGSNMGGGGGDEETEGEDTDGEEQEGDYTVYECPGLAATDEMEVKNPLFDYADPTPKP